jgi:hypothetical protein
MFSFSPIPFSHSMALELTQSLTEMSTTNLPEGKTWLARKDDDPTTICEPIVWKM